MNGYKEHQPPLDIGGQIRNLYEIGLEIEDVECAKKFLNDVSYFRLIKGYGLGLKPKNGDFPSGDKECMGFPPDWYDVLLQD